MRVPELGSSRIRQDLNGERLSLAIRRQSSNFLMQMLEGDMQ